MARVAVRFGLGTIVATGVVAGIIFAAFELFAAALLRPEAAVMPIRMIGAMILGSEALDPGYSLTVAASMGVMVHMILSVLFAGILAAIAPPLIATSGFALNGVSGSFVGIGFGIALWLFNFYIVAPLAGWTWFPERTDPLVQFLAHAFFFGCPVGWMLGRSRAYLGPAI